VLDCRPMDPIAVTARKTWRTLEPYHGLVYFAPEAPAAYAELGIDGMDGYFASRSAAFGEASAELVLATFYNFNPAIVRHAMPAVWSAASPAAVLDARRRAAGAALDRLTGDALAGADLDRAVELIRPAADAVAESIAGRPLAAAHLALQWPAEPRVALWHAITVLREHRGDGHNAALVAAGVDGCEANQLAVSDGAVPEARQQSVRGWSDERWAAAAARAAGRPPGFRAGIEAATDRLAQAPVDALGPDGLDELCAGLRPLVAALVDSGTIGYPNPVGVPPVP